MRQQDRTSDVVIIGGGVIGLACADALAREGLGVTVLERGACGRESSPIFATVALFAVKSPNPIRLF
jgi:glycine/D-amino acid oxidase-like deaminating enzyme